MRAKRTPGVILPDLNGTGWCLASGGITLLARYSLKTGKLIHPSKNYPIPPHWIRFGVPPADWKEPTPEPKSEAEAAKPATPKAPPARAARRRRRKSSR